MSERAKKCPGRECTVLTYEIKSRRNERMPPYHTSAVGGEWLSNDGYLREKRGSRDCGALRSVIARIHDLQPSGFRGLSFWSEPVHLDSGRRNG